jgi:hypothetical protein
MSEIQLAIGRFVSIILMLLGMAYLSMIFLGADNFIEEAIENILKDKLGKHVDLSPYQGGKCK